MTERASPTNSPASREERALRVYLVIGILVGGAIVTAIRAYLEKPIGPGIVDTAIIVIAGLVGGYVGRRWGTPST